SSSAFNAAWWRETFESSSVRSESGSRPITKRSPEISTAPLSPSPAMIRRISAEPRRDPRAGAKRVQLLVVAVSVGRLRAADREGARSEQLSVPNVGFGAEGRPDVPGVDAWPKPP